MGRRSPEWISLNRAAAIFGMARETFLRHFASRITQQRMPGGSARYRRVEVEALAEQCIVRPTPQD